MGLKLRSCWTTRLQQLHQCGSNQRQSRNWTSVQHRGNRNLLLSEKSGELLLSLNLKLQELHCSSHISMKSFYFVILVCFTTLICLCLCSRLTYDPIIFSAALYFPSRAHGSEPCCLWCLLQPLSCEHIAAAPG